MKIRHFILIALLIPTLVVLRFVGEVGIERPRKYVVTKIFDGDTVELNGKDRLRLLGIDTPELGEIFHDKAKDFLFRSVKGKEVTIRFDRRKRDRYGRLLGYLFCDTVFVNAAILDSGLGSVYFFPDYASNIELQQTLLEAQKRAIDHQVGVWSLPYNSLEAYYIGNSKRLRFHRPSCGAVENLAVEFREIFPGREEPFLAGFSACRNCKP